MNYRLQLKLTIPILLLICQIEVGAQSVSFKEAVQSKKIVFELIHNGEKEWAAENDQGEMEGILTDMMSEFKSFLASNYEIEAVLNYKLERDFTLFQKRIEHGTSNTFGLTYMTITEERKKRFQFSTPFMNNIEMLITRNDVKMLKSKSAISSLFLGKKAVIVRSSSNYTYLMSIKEQYYPGMKVEYVNSDLKAIQKVLSDNNYFTIVDYFRYLDAYKNGDGLSRQKIFDFVHGSFGITMPLSSDWKSVFDEFLEEYLQSVSYRRSMTKNLDVSALRLIPRANG